MQWNIWNTRCQMYSIYLCTFSQPDGLSFSLVERVVVVVVTFSILFAIFFLHKVLSCVYVYKRFSCPVLHIYVWWRILDLSGCIKSNWKSYLGVLIEQNYIHHTFYGPIENHLRVSQLRKLVMKLGYEKGAQCLWILFDNGQLIRGRAASLLLFFFLLLAQS